MELDTKAEHFVQQVVIDGDKVKIICSCGSATQEFKEPKKQNKDNPGAEAQAREEFDKHYEDVMH